MPLSTTLDHVTIVAEDFGASRAVYDALLGCLGLAPSVDFEDPEGDSDDTGTVAAVGYSDATGRLLLAGPVATTGAHLALAVTEPERARRGAQGQDSGAAGAARVGIPPIALLRNAIQRSSRQSGRGGAASIWRSPDGPGRELAVAAVIFVIG
jgi:catechol 2,3-dioxygenase-like lactoylglutathione lyase family enzyme